ncbi:hypothetical protein, partial [Shewanella indica]|uniref:hypothetical protein n=1 Tax=Shewanella indica TaxID=768528 RepID=UPI00300617C2
GLKIGKLSHRTSIKDGLGRHIGSCGPLNRSFLRFWVACEATNPKRLGQTQLGAWLQLDVDGYRSEF